MITQAQVQQSEDAAERRSDIRATLRNVITATEQALNTKRDLESKRQDSQNLQKFRENTLRMAVSEEMVGDKKKYTNAEQRDSALAILEANDPEYKEYSKTFAELSKQISEMGDTLEILKMKFRAAQAETDLERLEV